MSFTSDRRDLLLVVSAKAVSLFGDEVAAVALVLRLQAHGAGPAAVAALLTAGMLPLVLLAGVVGRLVDTVDSRRLLVVSGLLQAGVCTVLATVNSTAAVLGLVAVLGAGQAVNGATWQSLLPAIAGPDDLPRALGLAQAGTTVAGIAAPAAGGVLVGQYGSHLPLLVDAATFLAVTVAGVLLSAQRQVGGAGEGAPSPRGALRIIRSDPLLRLLIALLALFVLVGSMVNVIEVFLIRETLHASSTWYGVVGAALGVGLLTGALLGGRVRGTTSLSRMFVGSAALLATGLVAVGLSPTVGWVLPAAYALGLGNGMLNVALGSLVMGRAAAGERGRVAALMSGVASGTQLAAFVVAAALAIALTPREIFVIAGTGALAVTALLGRGLLAVAKAEQIPGSRNDEVARSDQSQTQAA
jgi:MFS family permease